jgi:hypothetical protein
MVVAGRSIPDKLVRTLKRSHVKRSEAISVNLGSLSYIRDAVDVFVDRIWVSCILLWSFGTHYGQSGSFVSYICKIGTSPRSRDASNRVIWFVMCVFSIPPSIYQIVGIEYVKVSYFHPSH